MMQSKVEWRPYEFNMEGILDQALIGDIDLSTILRAGSDELKAWVGS